jgi:hypothetical protein
MGRMIKYLSAFLFILFLSGIEKVYSQGAVDTLVKSEFADTVHPDNTYPVAAGEDNSESRYQPIADSSYVFSDTVRKVSAVQLRSYLLNPDYAYAIDPEYWRKDEPEKPGSSNNIFNSSWLAWIVRLAVMALVLFGIYQLARENNFSWLVRRGKAVMSESREMVPEDEMDYDLAAKKYQAEGNYRMAVRYMYLRLIHAVHAEKGIVFRDSSTNTEIARALGNHPRAEDFRYLTMAYEYIFYGGFTPGKEQFDTIKNKFDFFHQSIST